MTAVTARIRTETVPTPDHFIPLLYLAGLAKADDEKPEMRGTTLGSFSMTSYGLGLDIAAIKAAGGGGDIPRSVPPDQTNIQQGKPSKHRQSSVDLA